MGDFQELIKKLIAFRDARDWAQFHKPKDLAAAIAIEAGELQELFLWKGDEEAAMVDREKVAEEIADILAFTLLLANHYDFDVKEIVMNKIAKNDEKYPVDKAKGSAKKYSDL
jgi:NTP pyrophosphatase (non-canonical NTP hydrolase)